MNHLSESRKTMGRYDWWFAARWRVFLTWMALAMASGAVLSYQSGNWLEQHVAGFVQTLKKHGVPMPANDLLRLLSIIAFLSWYQPVALQIGAVRSVSWTIVFCILTLGTLVCQERLPLSIRLTNVFIVGNLCGLAGLVAIGARTRAWMSLVGGMLSILVLSFVMPDETRASNMVWLVTASQAVYGAVMVYGTRRIERTDQEECGMPESAM